MSSNAHLVVGLEVTMPMASSAFVYSQDSALLVAGGCRPNHRPDVFLSICDGGGHVNFRTRAEAEEEIKLTCMVELVFTSTFA